MKETSSRINFARLLVGFSTTYNDDGSLSDGKGYGIGIGEHREYDKPTL